MYEDDEESENYTSQLTAGADKEGLTYGDNVEIENYTTQLTAVGADVSAKDKDGNTPLHIGVMNHDYPFVRDLLRNVQADINITNGLGKSALHLALDKVKQRSPNLLNSKYCHESIHSENRQQRIQEKIIPAILDRLPNLNVKDNGGRSALDIAKMSHNIFLVELLKSKGGTSLQLFSINSSK